MKTMKRAISVLLIAALVMMISGMAAFASSTKVTTGSVNMRKGAGLSYKKVQVVPSGVKLTVTKQKTDGRGRMWYYTTYKGKSGWISGLYLSASGTSTAKKVTATGGSSYIRSDAKRSAKIVGGIPSGKSATFLGSTKKDERKVVWYKVKYNGVTGWVSSTYTNLQ